MTGVAMTSILAAAHQLQTTAEGAIVAVAPAWVASGDWEVQGYSSAAACLSARTGRRRSASHDLLRTAAVARDAPALLNAATAGALPLSHLSLIAKCRDDGLEELFDRDQWFLVDTAKALGAEELATFLAVWRRRAHEELRRNEPDPKPPPPETDRLRLVKTFQERHLFDGELCGESAAVIIGAVEDRIDQWHRSGALKNDTRTANELFAAALIDICRRGPGTGMQDGAPRPSLICVTDLDLLCDRIGIDPEDRALLRAEILRGGTTGRDTVQRLFCEADTSIVLMHDGEPLFVRHDQPMPTRAQRRALLGRSRGHCEVPGCHNVHCDAHHIIWRSRNGPT